MKICLMEMDDRTRQSMVLVLSHRADAGISLADVDTANVAVLDLDHENAPQEFLKVHERHPALRAIGLTARPDQAHPDMLVLRKPVSASRLLEALQMLDGSGTASTTVLAAAAASSLGARAGNTRRRAETAATPTREQPHFDPNAYLLGTLLEAGAEALKNGKVAVVGFYGDRIILIDSRAGLVQTNLSASQARAFALSAFDGDAAAGSAAGFKRPKIEYVTRAEADARYHGKTYDTPQEVFLWQMGAMTSRGRLPAGIDTEERVYLRRWPNMTRFPYSDNEMRIVAYWMRQATSLREIAEALGIPEREVFSVYAAAQAAGLAGKARREVDDIWEAPVVAEHSERGLFSSIMRRLLRRRPATQEDAQVAA